MRVRPPAASRARDGTARTLPCQRTSTPPNTPRILTTPRASAYIKIAEGCDHPCSFCIIPQLRGKFRSRPIASVVAEAQHLIAQGVREITLIGQDTTCYGEDLAPDTDGRRVSSLIFSTRSLGSPASSGCAFSTHTRTRSQRACSKPSRATTTSRSTSTFRCSTPAPTSFAA